MRRIFVLLTALMTLVLCQAQLPDKDDWRSRLGVINPQKAKELYGQVFSRQSPIMPGNEKDTIDIAFYIKFRQLATLAPYCDYMFYSGYLYDTPTSMYKRMLDSVDDPAVRVMLVDDVIEHGKDYVENLDSINVLRSQNTSTVGDALSMPLAKIRRAHYNYLFAHEPKYYPSHLYDKEGAYNLYRDAFKEFYDSKESAGKELHGFYVLEYFKVCYDLYKSNEDKYYEQFLGDYQRLVRVCSKLLIPYYDVPDSVKNNPRNKQYAMFREYNSAAYGVEIKYLGDTIINGQFIEHYDTIPMGIKPLFQASGAGSAAKIGTYYGSRLEQNRNNRDFLNEAIHFMYENGFTNDAVFFEYCKASYKLGKTYENCIGLAKSSQLGLVNKDEMRKYYEDALQLSSSEIDKAKIRYFMARSLFTSRPQYVEKNAKGDTVMVKKQVRAKDGSLVLRDMPKYVNYPYSSPQYQQWQNELMMCNVNLMEMLKSSALLLKDPRIDIRDYVAQAYYMMGVNGYVRSAQLHSLELADESLRNLRTAEQMKMRASHINGRAANATEYISKLVELRNSIQEAIRDKAKRDKWQRDYEEYLRKREAEERFWKQK